MRRPLAFVLVALFSTACTARDATGPAALLARGFPEAGERGVTVMTRNIYLGADVDPIVNESDASQIPLLVSAAWATVQATDFPARAEALADEIAATRPHLVGLQEVALFRVQIPSDAVLGGTTPATTVAFDFLDILLATLTARGLSYEPVVVQQGTDAEAPGILSFSPLAFFDVRFTDRDVILARSDVVIDNAQSANFTARHPLPLGGFLLRSWTSADATVAGNTIRFVNTHLEVEVFADTQAAQAAELLDVLADSPHPVVLVGDINSEADGGSTPTYATLRGAGFADAWNQTRLPESGFTCCHAADLTNPVSSLSKRIDVILVRGALRTRDGRIVGGAHADVVGEELNDRTPGGLWPSDHAGVVATLEIPPAVARR